MAKRRVLDRLLRLRELEEELARVDLEYAAGERDRVARQLASAVARHARGRRDFAAGLGDADTAARTGAVIDLEQARKLRIRIEPRLEAAEGEVARQRAEFLARRTGRRQVETLLEEQQREAREEAVRRAQQILDDWFGRRSPRLNERLGKLDKRVRKPTARPPSFSAGKPEGNTADAAPNSGEQPDPQIAPFP